MKRPKSKRIAAIIGIIAILSLYVISFIIGIFFSDEYPQLFLASVFLAVIIPIIVYCLVAVYRNVHKKAEYKKSEEADDKDNK
jgi:cytosine/uracil/thiamine/allantoin permease